jgi:SOS-response transcriptional repressor LexA
MYYAAMAIFMESGIKPDSTVVISRGENTQSSAQIHLLGRAINRNSLIFRKSKFPLTG